MKDIIPAKKQSPILGLTGMGGGVGSNIVAGLPVEKSKWIDELFNTYTYRGNATARTINTGIDISKNGGLVWLKNRDTNNYNHNLFDTVRGATKLLNSNATTVNTTNANTLTSFNNNGFSIGNDVQVNNNNEDQIAWTFSERKGLFDIVKYTGDGVAGRTVPHGLDCIPGSIIIKSTDNATSWFTYHGAVDPYGDAPWTKYLMLNHPNAVGTESWFMNDTAPTASQFTLGSSTNINGAGREYVAYIFAGAESSAATAPSVDFDGSGDYLSIAASSDLNLSGEFTIEAWVNVHDHGWSGTRRTLLANNIGWTTNHAAISLMNSAGASEENTMILYNNSSTIATSAPVRIEPSDGWTHIAITRDSSNIIRFWKNGSQAGGTTNYSGEFKFGTGTTWIGAITMSTGSTPEVFDGKISNLRVINGTALYTTEFKVPTEPLTNITNTKLLCCNGSTTTASTVTPGTITANGDPTASIDSPFDDPDCFKFGENEDQQVIKCGSYIGNGSSDGPDVYLGWEPQWLMVKSSLQATEQWHIIDNLRGMNASGINEIHMEASTMNGDLSATLFNPHSRGFKVATADSKMNNNNGVYIYYAIRRPDGLVGKPVEAGTEVFAMDGSGDGDSIIPNFESGFPVDFALNRTPASAQSFYISSRVTGPEYGMLDNQNPMTWNAQYDWDSNIGWGSGTFMDSSKMSWMWKRHAGFDVVNYVGTGSNMYIPHNLGRVPEMMWVQARTQSGNYKSIYHKGLNNGTNPQNYRINLFDSNGQTSTSFWNSTAPTADWFCVGNSYTMGNNEKYIMMLFASIPGISKCGYYTGDGSNPTITTGFSPRFLLIKRTNTSGDWMTFDTVRGFSQGSGAADCYLKLNSNDAQNCNDDWGYPTSDGFVIATNQQTGGNTSNYIYYAHA